MLFIEAKWLLCFSNCFPCNVTVCNGPGPGAWVHRSGGEVDGGGVNTGTWLPD